MMVEILFLTHTHASNFYSALLLKIEKLRAIANFKEQFQIVI